MEKITKYSGAIINKRLNKKQKFLKAHQKRYTVLVDEIIKKYGGDKNNRIDWQKYGKRLKNCCQQTIDAHNDKTGKSISVMTFGCNGKMCPICGSVLARKNGRALEMVLKRAYHEHNVSYKVLDLTVKNTFTVKDTQVVIKLMEQVFNNMMKQPFMEKVVGYFKKFEITGSKEKGLHPHFHVTLAVKNNNKSLDYKSIQEYWEKCFAKKNIIAKRVNLNNLKTEKGGEIKSTKDFTSAVKYWTKYGAKIGCVLKDKNGNPLPLEESVDLYYKMSEVVYRKSMFSYGGILKDIKAEITEEEIKSKKVIDEFGYLQGEEPEVKADYYSFSQWNGTEQRVKFIGKVLDDVIESTKLVNRMEKIKSKIAYYEAMPGKLRRVYLHTERTWRTRGSKALEEFYGYVCSGKIEIIEKLEVK